MTLARGAELGWDGCQGGWSVTGVAYPYSYIPLAGDLGDLVLTGHAAIGSSRASEALPRGAHEVAGRAGLTAPVGPDGGRREGRACGSGRPDGW